MTYSISPKSTPAWIVCVVLFLSGGTLLANVRPFLFEGERYIRLQDLALFYGGELIPTPDAKQVMIRTRWAELVFNPDGRELRIGTTLVWLHEPMRKIKSSWAIRESDALHVIDPVIRPHEYLKDSGFRVVVLDAGHGGLDTGAKGRRGSEEKHAALDITRRVRSHLTAAGLKVYLTRESDRFIELEERSRIARKLGANLFVSIHLNSAASTEAHGVETFVLATAGSSSTVGGNRMDALPGNKFDAQNSLLGFHLQRSLTSEVKSYDRGLKRSRFIVLRNAPCPAALIECGFLSNAAEEANIMSETYREQLARGIAKGILNYVTLARQSQRGTP